MLENLENIALFLVKMSQINRIQIKQKLKQFQIKVWSLRCQIYQKKTSAPTLISKKRFHVNLKRHVERKISNI